MKRLLTVTVFTGMLTLLRMGAGFIVAKVVAIYAGPTGLAMLGQLQSISSGLSGLVSAPVGNGLIRYTAEHHDKGYISCIPWWRASVRWVVIILLFTVPFILFYSRYLSLWLFGNSDFSLYISIMGIMLPLTALGTLINSVVNGQKRYKRYVLLGMLSVIVSSSLMVFLIIYKGLSGALTAISIQSGVTGMMLLLLSLKEPWLKFSNWWGYTEWKYNKAISGYILMAVTTALTVPTSMIIIRNILIHYVGWEGAGHWQAVWKISETYLAVLTIALGTYYLPKLSAIKNIHSVRIEVLNTAKVIIPISILLALGVYIFRDVILYLLFTSEFKSARYLFLVQLCGDVVKISSWLFAYPMLSRGDTKWYISTEIIFSISFVLFVWIFVHLFGLHGANYAYLFNYTIYFILMYIYINRYAK